MSAEPWKDWRGTTMRDMYNSESNLSWYANYWPQGSYGGYQRLEPARFPGVDNPPFLNSAYSDSGYVPCGPERPCPWGGSNNEGVIVRTNGKPTRRGMCLPSGKCDCPLGQDTGRFCSGLAHRDAFGETAWAYSEVGAQITDPYQASNFSW